MLLLPLLFCTHSSVTAVHPPMNSLSCSWVSCFSCSSCSCSSSSFSSPCSHAVHYREEGEHWRLPISPLPPLFCVLQWTLPLPSLTIFFLLPPQFSAHLAYLDALCGARQTVQWGVDSFHRRWVLRIMTIIPAMIRSEYLYHFFLSKCSMWYCQDQGHPDTWMHGCHPWPNTTEQTSCARCLAC